MFSGIIERLGEVKVASSNEGSLTCQIVTGYQDLALGESVAINGVCLTVAKLTDDETAEFFASSETLARSNLGGLTAKPKVNVERAVSLNTRLSGHMVQGHVDGLGRIASITEQQGSWLLLVDLPQSLSRYCVEKGSITLNGISLTLNSLETLADGKLRVSLMIIPHTWEHTNLHAAKVGDNLNVEVDVIAKYVERLCQPYLKS